MGSFQLLDLGIGRHIAWDSLPRPYAYDVNVGPARAFLGEAENSPWFRPCIAAIAGQEIVVVQVVASKDLALHRFDPRLAPISGYTYRRRAAAISPPILKVVSSVPFQFNRWSSKLQ